MHALPAPHLKSPLMKTFATLILTFALVAHAPPLCTMPPGKATPRPSSPSSMSAPIRTRGTQTTPPPCTGWLTEATIKAIVALLDAGADPNIKRMDGNTALHWAAMRGTAAAAIAVLLDAGADPNVKSKDGDTPLHWAAERGDTAGLAALLAAGADPNVQDSLGITALHWAAQRGDIAAIAALLDAGADPNAETTKKPTTPLDWAAQGGHTKAIAVMRAAIGQ